MSPRLPPEVLSEILDFALLNEHPAGRQLTRNRFRLVDRDWHSSFNYWKEIDVVGLQQVDRLGLHLEQTGPVPIQGAFVELTVADDDEEEDEAEYDDDDGSKNEHALALDEAAVRLLAGLGGLKRLELIRDWEVLRPDDDDYPAFIDALCDMTELE